jgi:uncharacterized protein (TIGR00106 family)
MSTIVELSVFPTDKGQSVSPYVARVLRIIADSGLDYELNAMGTCIEGERAEIMQVVSRCFEALEADCSRIYMTLKADYRKGIDGRLKKKVRSVETKM